MGRPDRRRGPHATRSSCQESTRFRIPDAKASPWDFEIFKRNYLATRCRLSLLTPAKASGSSIAALAYASCRRNAEAGPIIIDEASPGRRGIMPKPATRQAWKKVPTTTKPRQKSAVEQRRALRRKEAHPNTAATATRPRGMPVPSRRRESLKPASEPWTTTRTKLWTRPSTRRRRRNLPHHFLLRHHKQFLHELAQGAHDSDHVQRPGVHPR